MPDISAELQEKFNVMAQHAYDHVAGLDDRMLGALVATAFIHGNAAFLMEEHGLEWALEVLRGVLEWVESEHRARCN